MSNHPLPESEPLPPHYLFGNAVAQAIVEAMRPIPCWLWLNTLTLIFAQIAGNMTLRAWAIFNQDPKPCGEPGCECEKERQAVLNCLRTLRDIHARTIATRKPNG